MKKLYLLPFFIFLLVAFFLWRGLSLNPTLQPSTYIGKPLPEIKLLSTDNKFHTIGEHFNTEYFLINIWASWCNSCFAEHTFLLDLAKAKIPVYGLNYKDSPTDARKFLTNWGNPYKVIGFDMSGKAAIELGVYGAPETFLVDNHGIIRHRYAGVLNNKIWQEEFIPLINQYEHTQ